MRHASGQVARQRDQENQINVNQICSAQLNMHRLSQTNKCRRRRFCQIQRRLPHAGGSLTDRIR